MYLFSLDREKYSFIEADNENFNYTGRIDFSNKKAPTFIYAGSMIFTKFKGTSVKVALKNRHYCYENSIGYILDRNIYGKVVIPNNSNKLVIDIMSGLKDTEHELIIYKRQDACHYFDFYGLVLDKGCSISPAGKKPERRMECFGDSVAAGELVEVSKNADKKKLNNLREKKSNGCLSFPLIAARYLGAQINNNAQSGLALLNETGLYRKEKPLGLEFTYDKLKYNRGLGKCTKWDFTTYIPHVVIMEFGHYDCYPDNFINTDMEKRLKWKEKYKEIIRDLRSKYPKALFVIVTSIVKHDLAWDDALDEVQEELNDPKVVRYKFIRNGCGPTGYADADQQAEMGQELTEFINSFGNEIWE